MKVSALSCIKLGIFLGAGWEIGRTLPRVLVTVLSPESRKEIRERYKEGLKKAEKQRIHLVKNDKTPTSGA